MAWVSLMPKFFVNKSISSIITPPYAYINPVYV
jgi:hypothetical protein